MTSNSTLHRALQWLGLIAALLANIACTSTSPYDANSLAQKYQWHSSIIATEHLNFMTFSAPESVKKAAQKTLFIYLEGDGQAWASRYQASSNPTPANAMGLGLAIQHQGSKVVYLARPCQFLTQAYLKNCDAKLWTSGRYSELAISGTHQAVLQLKQQYNAETIILVGYSGGGTLAAFVAAREKSISQLVTVAAPIDHNAWTQLHKVSKLTDSLSIQPYTAALANIPQIHFSGDQDKIVPSQLIEQWATQLTGHFPHTSVRIVTLANFNHQCCWVDKWAALSEQYLGSR